MSTIRTTHHPKRRVNLGLLFAQHEFARKAGISQSMVAKIEAGKLDPTYSYVKKIEGTIELLTKHQEKEAKDIMVKKVIAVQKGELVQKAIKLLAEHDISQVPVLDKNTVVGLITESDILEYRQEDLHDKKVEDVIKESPLIIAPNTKLSVIASLLKFYPLLIVKDKGIPKGVVTKADVLKSL